MERTQKEKLVASLHEVFADVGLLVVTRPLGLTVAEATELRRKMGAAGAGFRVTKNRLTRLALKGTLYEGLAPLFEGPTAIAFSRDPVAAAKVAVAFAKGNEKLTILGGAIGKRVLDAEGVRAVAALPSLDELRAKILGLLRAPATRLAVTLRAPAGRLARALHARASQHEAG